MKRATLTGTLLLVGGGTTIALDAPSAPRERTILVSIFDKNGFPVRQVSSGGIQVAENGQPVKILRLRPANDSAILFTVLVDTSKWAQQEKTSAASMVWWISCRELCVQMTGLSLPAFLIAFTMVTQRAISVRQRKKSTT